MSRYNIKNKVILVTGAAQGVGAALVELLLEGGAIPVAVDLPSEKLDDLRHQVGRRGLVASCDVTSADGMQEVVREATRRYGRLDVVVANAGIERIGPLHRMPAKVFERVIEVNLLGVYRTIQPALEEVIRNRGHVVAVSSIAGLVPWPFAIAYGSSKAAVDSLIRSLRIELAPQGATAGAVYFGHISTPMMQRSTSDPVGREVLRGMPKAVGILPKPPSVAAKAILRNIQNRSARDYSHFSVKVALWLRGLYQAADPLLPRQLRAGKILEQYYPATRAEVRLLPPKTGS